MKNGTYLLLFFLLSQVTIGQGVFSNQTNTALQKVIEDFPNRFRNIKGEPVSEKNSTDYKSKVEMPGAINCVISSNGHQKDNYTWKAQLYQSADFEQARKNSANCITRFIIPSSKLKAKSPLSLTVNTKRPTTKKICQHQLPRTAVNRRYESPESRTFAAGINRHMDHHAQCA